MTTRNSTRKAMKVTQQAAAQTPQPWVVADMIGLRKILERNGSKTWAIHELVQNAWDEDVTEVIVTLTEPKDGVSVLTCRDNSSKGYADLSSAYKMFAQSYKKADPTKRGRFNAGEKHVLALCNEARLTSTSGTILWNADRTRTTSPAKTEVGSEFTGVLPLTAKEYAVMVKEVQRIFPPVKTIFNGVEIPTRKPIHTFMFTLATQIADDNGVLHDTKRKTEVRLYNTMPGEKPTLYEKGLPVVEVENVLRWHVDVQQKIPLNTERNNVLLSYRKAINVAVVSEMAAHFGKEEVAAPEIQQAMADERVPAQVLNTLLDKQYGKERVLESTKDVGSNNEAASQGNKVVPRRAMSPDLRKRALETGAIKHAHDVTPTDIPNITPERTLHPSEYDDNQRRFVKFIEDVSPLILAHPVTVSIIEDDRQEFAGCTRWKKDGYLFEINLAYQDTDKWVDNYELFIHELAHHKLQSNDHLRDIFYRSVTEIGAKLAQLVVMQPRLFEGTTAPFMPVPVLEHRQEEDVAASK